jgi:hypothetical protein
VNAAALTTTTTGASEDEIIPFKYFIYFSVKSS